MAQIDTDLAELWDGTISADSFTGFYKGDSWKGFSIQANVTDGSFTAGMYAVLQASNDGVNFANVYESTTTVSGVGTLLWNYDAPYFNHARLRWVVPSGNIVSTVSIRMIGER
jgi:hypothetical protein